MKNYFWIESWDKFLLILFSLLGAGFFSSGVVTWIAANWEAFSKFEKLFGVQTLLVGLIAASLWLARRPNPTVRLSLIWFTAAVVIGGLFALLGQIYQTGADPWQLFALWAVLQLPLWIALPNVAGILLALVTANLALFLFPWDSEFHSYFFSALLNLAALALCEYQTKWADPWRILPRLLAASVVAALLALNFEGSDSPQSWTILLFGGLAWYSLKLRQDIVNYVLFYVAIAAQLVISLNWRYFEGLLYLSTLITLVALIVLTVQLHGWAKNANIKLKSNFCFILLYLLFAQMAVGLVLGIVVPFFSSELEWAIRLVSLLFFVAAMIFRQNKQSLFTDLSFAMALISGCVTSLFEQQMLPIFALLAGYSLLIYTLTPTVWLRTLALLCLFFQLIVGFYYEYWEVMAAQLPQLLLASLLIFYLVPYSRFDLRPLGWALLLATLGLDLTLLQPFYVFMYQGEAEPLPEVNSILEGIHLVTKEAFAQFSPWRWLGIFSPVLLFWLINRSQSSRHNRGHY